LRDFSFKMIERILFIILEMWKWIFNRFMCKGSLVTWVSCNLMTTSFDTIFIWNDSFKSNRSTRMHFWSWDSNFCSKSISKSICKSSWCIYIDSSWINSINEFLLWIYLNWKGISYLFIFSFYFLFHFIFDFFLFEPWFSVTMESVWWDP